MIHLRIECHINNIGCYITENYKQFLCFLLFKFELIHEFNSLYRPGPGVVRESSFGEWVQILKMQGGIDSHES